MLKQNTTYNLIRNISIVLLFPSDACIWQPLTIRSFPANNSLDITQDRTLRWQVFAVAVLVIWNFVAMSCRDSGALERGQHRETEAPLQSRGRCWWDSQWWWLVVASVDLWARGQLCSGLADGLAVCLGLCSLWRWARLLRGVVCAGACGDLRGGSIEQSSPPGPWGGAGLCVVLILLRLWGRSEVQRAGQFDRAERRARWDEVDLVFVGTGEEGGWCRCGLPWAEEKDMQRQTGSFQR